MSTKKPDKHESFGEGERGFRETMPRTTRGEKVDLDAGLKEELAPSFKIIRSLGRGTQGKVYLAREPALKRLVAIKVLAPELAQEETARLRFEREAQSLAPLASHPNMISVYSVGELSDGRPYIVMQYVKGPTMEERIKAEGKLPVEEALRIVREVASALAAAHRNGLLHRNLQPGNIFYEEETQRPYLSGFSVVGVLPTGVAEESSQLTQTGELLGTPAYMSPEQLLGQPLTERNDVYCLGLLAYELLTGRAPFEGRELQQLVAARLREEPKNLSELRPELDPAVARMLERCVARQPGHRPSAADVAEGLAPAGPAAARASLGGESTSRPGVWSSLLERRLPQVVGGYVIAALAVTVLTGMLARRGVFPDSATALWLAFAIPGFLGALVISWFHGKRGVQRIGALEVWLLSGLALVWLVASVFILGR